MVNFLLFDYFIGRISFLLAIEFRSGCAVVVHFDGVSVRLLGGSVELTLFVFFLVRRLVLYQGPYYLINVELILLVSFRAHPVRFLRRTLIQFDVDLAGSRRVEQSQVAASLCVLYLDFGRPLRSDLLLLQCESRALVRTHKHGRVLSRFVVGARDALRHVSVSDF